MTIHTDDQLCQNCQKPMFGIKCLSRRQICEDCGGNETEYNAKNQHPLNWQRFEQGKAKR